MAKKSDKDSTPSNNLNKSPKFDPANRGPQLSKNQINRSNVYNPAGRGRQGGSGAAKKGG